MWVATQKPKIPEKCTKKLKKQLDENQKNTKTEISTKLVPVSTSRLSGWVPPFVPLVTAWELGGLARVVTVMFVVRMSRSQRLQASSATRSGLRRGVAERASD